jgi:5-bromo-4-chloroindolyl phosphate hydrolysis protein
MILSRRRYDRNYNRFEDPDYYGNRSGRGLFGLVFSLVSMGLNIAFGVVSMVFQVLSSLLGGQPSRPRRYQYQAEFTAEREQAKQAPPKEDIRTDANSKPNTEKKQEIKKEQVKQTFNQHKEEHHGSDWNILLFVITLIPLIITLAMKRIDLAGLVLAGGILLIALYNMLRGAAASSKKRKQEKADMAEEPVEAGETETMIKEAFEKVYGIRKELYKISKIEIKEKVERLCDNAEKILGEVRSNPECINAVRKFFYYYLDTLREVFEKYLKLSNFSNSSEEVQKLLVETEKSFDDLEAIFQEMCEGMLEKDMLNLKATINVLKNSNYSGS